MTFLDLGVPARLDSVLATQGITDPTPIQSATLPDSLAGRDVLGRGRTGSGKTLAFLLPVIARLAASGRTVPGAPRALVLAPTRELAGQIDAALQPLAAAVGLTSRTVFGGVGQNPQVTAIRRGVDIVVACPGRLEDLVSQGACALDRVEITVLDEADHMCDLGFLPAVRRLLARTPSGGQRLLFSATLDKAVDSLAKQFLTSPAVHHADSAQSPVAAMTHHVLHVDREARADVLADLACAPGRTVVFTRTKHGAKTLARKLNAGGVPAVELHGNLSQNARERNLDAFHSGRVETLVATDIAARGIHVDDVALVVHADPPADHKAFLHRSGRTARAGSGGTVVTLATTDQLREVDSLVRLARVNPTRTRVSSVGDPILTVIAPGERVLRTVEPIAAPQPTPRSDRPAGSRRRRGGSGHRNPARTGESTARGTASGRGSAAGRGSTAARGTGAAAGSARQAPGRSRPAAAAAATGGRTHSAGSYSASRGRR